MLSFPSCQWRRAASLALTAAIVLAACNRRGHRVLEVNYVSAPEAMLRDQVAAVYNRVGSVKNGERVEVLEHDRRFARVRTVSGTEGWIEQRYLVDQKTFNALQKLAQQSANYPVQAPGVLRNETNLHVTPGRETEHLYQLPAGTKVSILERATAEKQIVPLPEQSRPAAKSGAKPSGPPLEDWWLVRDSAGHAGWVLGHMLDVDAPLDIAQYAEGQRIVAFFVLGQVEDIDNGVQKKVPQYLCLLTDPHDGMAFDYNQVRVFTWNTRRHRYETAYREHGLNGVLPVTVTTENFDKEGVLPVFVLRVKDDSGNIVERKYKLNTPIVRRVLAPGEMPPKPVARRRRRDDPA